MTINEFDLGITKYVQSWPGWLHPIMFAATVIGYPATLMTLAVVGSVAAWRWAHPRIAVALMASLVALGLNTILKHFLHRTRPDTLYVTSMRIKSYSFPSGHAFGAVAFYGLLAYLAHKYLPAPWNNAVVLALIVLIFLIGLSRVYLGAHFPTDVLGGWILGGVALALIIAFIKP